MDKRLKLIFSCIAVLIVAAVFVYPISYEVFHWVRILIHLQIVMIPILYMSRGVKPYALPIAIGLFVYMASSHFTVYYGTFFELRVILSIFTLILFTKSFTYFKGYTYKTPHLLVLLIIAGAFYSAVFSKMGSMSALIGLFIIFFVFMCWQGANLYFIRKTHGYFYILLFVLVDICNNVTYGINLFITDFGFLSLLTQAMHWVALSILAYTTTLPRKKFKSLLRPQYRYSR